ncbi:50S ribosomal protein L24 [bacterium (Candidatus Torokbacteria) CG09_land_8_20_14_0_10_42_11]|nr:MAG: 50S ribosomal protein L24 [bacterium (Candidatus Torokbacteria) CG09_land_8_20_14_0_10_42_11]
MKLKKGDNIIVKSGKDRGKKGKIVRVLPDKNKIVVEGVNLVKRNSKPRRQGEKGQRVTVTAPFNLSNARLLCPKCNQVTRVGFRLTPQGKKRVCKKCKAEV